MISDKPIMIQMGAVLSFDGRLAVSYHCDNGQHRMSVSISQGRKSAFFLINDDSVHMVKDLIAEYEKCAEAGKAALQGLSQ